MTEFAKKIEQSLLKLFAMWKCDAQVEDATINAQEATITCKINNETYTFSYHTNAKGDVWFRV